MDKIVVRLGVREEWFNEWDGDLNDPEINRIKMFVNQKYSGIHLPAPSAMLDVVFIPFISQYTYAKYFNRYYNADLKQLPRLPFIKENEEHSSYMAFEVKSNDMNNGTQESYLVGDRLYCFEIARYQWETAKLHLPVHDFIIVCLDEILFKRITDHSIENHTITVHSLNDMYPDRVVDLNEVLQIFCVIESARVRRR